MASPHECYLGGHFPAQEVFKHFASPLPDGDQFHGKSREAYLKDLVWAGFLNSQGRQNIQGVNADENTRVRVHGEVQLPTRARNILPCAMFAIHVVESI